MCVARLLSNVNIKRRRSMCKATSHKSQPSVTAHLCAPVTSSRPLPLLEALAKAALAVAGVSLRASPALIRQRSLSGREEEVEADSEKPRPRLWQDSSGFLACPACESCVRLCGIILLPLEHFCHFKLTSRRSLERSGLVLKRA